VVGTFMKKYPDTTAVIEGHSDNVGKSDYNLKLSSSGRRAWCATWWMSSKSLLPG